MQRGDHELMGALFRLHGAQVGDDADRASARQAQTFARITALAMTDRGDEIELVDKRTRRLFKDDQHAFRRTGNLRRATGTRQTHFRRVVVAHHGGIDIAVIATGGMAPYSSQIVPSGPLPAGAAFSVIVTDDNGCVETISGTIPTPPAQLTASATHTNETISGLNNGTALAQATGGQMPYQFLWSNNATTAAVSNLAPGNYTCTIEDANGCQQVVSVTILPGTSSASELPGLRSLRLSPNPTSGMFELAIALDNPLSIQVELLDVTGRILTKTNEETVLERTWQFDLGFAPAGTYYCKVKSENGTALMRLVKVD